MYTKNKSESKQARLSHNQQGLIPLLIVLVGAIVAVIVFAYIRIHKAHHGY